MYVPFDLGDTRGPTPVAPHRLHLIAALSTWETLYLA